MIHAPPFHTACIVHIHLYPLLSRSWTYSQKLLIFIFIEIPTHEQAHIYSNIHSCTHSSPITYAHKIMHISTTLCRYVFILIHTSFSTFSFSFPFPFPFSFPVSISISPHAHLSSGVSLPPRGGGRVGDTHPHSSWRLFSATRRSPPLWGVMTMRNRWSWR